MNFKPLYGIFTIAFLTLFCVACNDELNNIGFTIQPGEDRLKIEVDTLYLQASTAKIDSIYSKTSYPALGEFIDPVFGTIKSEYIGEFYFPEGAGFKENASIDSVRVQISYTALLGDSLSPMGLSVYKVNKSLKDISHYSNGDPTDFADMSAPLGSQTFTGKNATYREESYTASDYSTVTYKVYEINVTLPKSIGEDFLAEYNKDGHGALVNPDDFREYFKGLYFTTTFGKSTILGVSLTSLQVHYKYNDPLGSSDGKSDTIRTSALQLYITPEVTQINHIQNKNTQLLAENPDFTYVKSPAGVITEITFPFSEVNNKLGSQALNLANFTVYAMPETDNGSLVKLSPPTYLLLVPKDSLNGFFEKKKLPDNVTSFVSKAFDSSTYKYSFTNIAAMANHYNEINEGKPFDLTYCLVPVDATYVTQQDYYGSTSSTLTGIQHQMWPTAVRLDKRLGNLKMDMIFSNF